MTRWASIDERGGVLQELELRAIERARASSRIVDGLLRSMPARVSVIRDHLAGQPASGLRSATSDLEADSDSWRRAWCSAHEQSVGRCRDLGEACVGEPRVGPSDPTGEAVVAGRDQAAADLEELLWLLNQHTSIGIRLARLLDAYPVNLVELPDTEPGPGAEY